MTAGDEPAPGPAARLAALKLVRLLATGHSTAAVKDHLLVNVAGSHGADALLEVTAATAVWFRQALELYATSPGHDLLAVIDGLSRTCENDL